MHSNSKVLRLFWSYWMRRPGLFIVGLLYGPVSAVQNIVVPLFVTLSLTQLIKTGHARLSTILIATIALAVAVILDYMFDAYSDAKIEQHVELGMYNDLFEKLTTQDYDFYANNFGGSLVNKNNQLVRAYSIFHITFFLDMLPQAFVVLFAFGIMLHLSLVLGSVILLVWLVSMALIVYLAVERIPLRREAVAFGSRQTGELADAVTNAIAVKTFAAEAHELQRYAETNKKRSDLYFQSWLKAIRNGGVVNALCAIIQIVVFAGGIYAVEHHTIDIPVFLLFQVYVLRIIDSLRHTNQIVRQLEGVFGDAQDALEVLDVEPQIQNIPAALGLRIKNGSLIFKDVDFKYEADSSDKLFAHLSLSIPGSQHIGLVGPSGGGKTTITKLILRFVEIQSGEITIDEQNITSVTQDSLRNSISYVPQEPLLFHRSIRENIAYGKPGASEQEIIAVAKKAYAHDFIESLPNGYDTLVGERGVKLSGGQRQRVAIARAMLKDAPILVLDEATSALDSESEKVIQEALWKLMEGKTAVVIAHRLSTIQRLDRIVVLDEGAIVEDGTHQELLEQKGLYAKLWAHQSGGFMED